MAGCGSEEKAYRRFLELFLREMRPPLREDSPVPARPLSDTVVEDEVEGECLDLCLQHLCKYVIRMAEGDLDVSCSKRGEGGKERGREQVMGGCFPLAL
ncbi:hypothetical protein QTP86_002477 [Hemibagrus guttatus]|nr:hypothetical protein QTP86_002477 [Hemibagrus guttatus]